MSKRSRLPYSEYLALSCRSLPLSKELEVFRGGSRLVEAPGGEGLHCRPTNEGLGLVWYRVIPRQPL